MSVPMASSRTQIYDSLKRGPVALEELRKCPDVTLVEVESPDEHVFVRKEGQDLKVDVRTRKGERFSVSVPLGGVEHVLAALSM